MRAGSTLPSQGFTFVAVLVLMAVSTLALSAAGPLWSQQSRRDKEQELLRIGMLYARALENYRERSPGSLRQYPARLDDLLQDKRYAGIVRHIRELYGDPVNPGQPWGLILTPDQRIAGVYSLSAGAPIIESPIDLGDLRLPAARRYADWKFAIQTKS